MADLIISSVLIFLFVSYCPGGPDSDFEYSTQSYTGYEVNSICFFISSPVGSLCHTRGVVRRPSFVVRRTSCVVCVHHNYQK